MRIFLLIMAVWLSLITPVLADSGFTQADRDRMIRLETRFEDMDKRFEQISIILYILSGIFTAMFTAIFGFAWWDRRSILLQAREEARIVFKPHEERRQDYEERVNKITELLRQVAEKMPELKELMHQLNLL